MKHPIINFFFTGIMLLLFSACGGSSSNPDPDPDREPEPDTSINSFVINQILDAEPNDEVISNTVTISGINQPVSLSVSGCSYSINSAMYQSADTTVSQSDTVSFKLTASELPETTVVCDITVSQFSTQFSVTTRGELVTIEVFAKSSSVDEIALTPSNLFIHDENGENQLAIEITDDKIVIPNSAQGVSYTLYANTDMYGYQYHQLYTIYEANAPQVHRIRPEDPGHLYDDCKSVTLTQNNGDPSVSSIGFYTASQCANIIGTASFSNSASLTLGISDSIQSENDLIYFTRNSDSNFLGYKLFSSVDFQDGEVIQADSLTLDTGFNTVTVVTESNNVGSFRVYGLQDGGSFGLLVGEHSLASGNNNTLVNIVDAEYDEYRLSYSFGKAAQSYLHSKIVASIPAIEDGLPSVKFLLSADLIDNQMSWTLDNGDRLSNVSVRLENSVDGVEYRWEIRAQDSGSIVIPSIPSLNTQDFLNDAQVRLYVSDYDEETMLSEGIFAGGSLDCQNDVCSLNMSLE
jgi:hypothetical protein